jgi:aspartate racemase
MRLLGLLGGMSWESTVPYYRLINQGVAARLGGLHSARLLLWNVDFAPLEDRLRAADWDGLGRELGTAARTLEQAGAQGLLLCTNTMHQVAPALSAAVGVPLLHIVDPTAEAIRRAGMTTVGLLGTRYTMELPFYAAHLGERHGLVTLVPEAEERALVHQVIFAELCRGVVRPESRAAYRRIMAGLVARGAEGIILGCTEIAMLVDASDAAVPLFDTTELHARAAVEWMLEGTA